MKQLVRCVLYIVVCAAWVFPASGSGQEGGTLQRAARDTSWQVLALPPITRDPALRAGNNLSYLPMVIGSPRVRISFGRSADTNGTLDGVSNQFAYGLTELHYRVEIESAQRYTFREEWFVNGRRVREIEQSGTVPADAPAVFYHDYICRAVNGRCGMPLERGTYTLNFYLNDTVFQSSTALIE